MSRMYSQAPDPHYVEAAKNVIPSGHANDKPVDFDILIARQVPAPVASKYLHAKTEGEAVVMEWADAPAALTALYIHKLDLTDETYGSFSIMFTSADSVPIEDYQSIPFGKYFVGETPDSTFILGFNVFSTAVATQYNIIYFNASAPGFSTATASITAINDTVTELK